MQHMLTRALQESGYHEKLARFAEENKHSTIKRGVGFASFMRRRIYRLRRAAG